MKLYNKTILMIALLIAGAIGNAMAQEALKSYSGKVFSSSTMQPLAEVEVVCVDKQGVSTHAKTNEEGEFTVECSSERVRLEFKYPGYITEVAFAKSGQKVSILLNLDHGNVGRDKYVGPATDAKVDEATFAKSVVKTVDQPIVAESVDDYLKAVSGMYTVKRSGLPGEGSDMVIRGMNSIHALQKPLVVVDGVVLGNYSFDYDAIPGNDYFRLAGINPNDIREITVLKDKAAAAIYGMQGSNGVILINTNQVEGGKTSINFKGSTGVSWNDERIPVMNAQQHKEYVLHQLFGQGYDADQINNEYPFLGNEAQAGEYPSYEQDTDWQDEIFKGSLQTDAHVGLKGGDQAAKFYAGVGLTSNNGTLDHSTMSRLTTQLNTQVNITSKLSIDVNLGFGNTTNKLTESGTNYVGNPIFAALTKTPMQGIYQALGNNEFNQVYEDQDAFAMSNPIVLVNDIEAKRKSYFLTGGFNFGYKFTPSLKLSVLVGTELNQTDETYFRPNYGVGVLPSDEAESVVSKSEQKYRAIYNENKLTFSKYLSNNQHIDLVAGTRLRTSEVELGAQSGLNTPIDDAITLSDTDDDTRRKDGYWEYYNHFSTYLYGSYDIAKKIFISGAVSVDSSSPIGELADGQEVGNTIVGIFPTLSLGYDLARESFINGDNTWFNKCLFRFSTGKSGNDQFGNYIAKDYYTASQYWSISGLARGGIMNNHIKWEDVYSWNLGLDLSLFRNAVKLNVNYFENTTKDMLVQSTLPDFYGYESVLVNDGEMETTGFEVDLDWQVIRGKDFNWNTRGTLSYSKSEITSLGANKIVELEGGNKIHKQGEAPGMFYGYKTKGVYQSSAQAEQIGLTDQFGNAFQAGDIIFADLDNNKVIDENDRTVIGNPMPDFFGSWINQFNYKRWSLYTQVNFVEGNDLYNYARNQMESFDGYANQSTAALSAWKKEGDVTSTPRVVYGDPMKNARFSDRWIENGSYIRLQNVTLSYRFNPQSSWLNSAEIFATGKNLYTWHEYLGYSPEFATGEGYETRGADYFKAPVSPTVLVGVKLGL
ncbi:SusC/RagA family TonB-linked outer membrane protein [Puteibacter caeruleilacunae]|nr:SusC/RagA family TonB-linked outer membrane protein [Puteibacter caeruleilacunae]